MLLRNRGPPVRTKSLDGCSCRGIHLGLLAPDQPRHNGQPGQSNRAVRAAQFRPQLDYRRSRFASKGPIAACLSARISRLSGSASTRSFSSTLPLQGTAMRRSPEPNSGSPPQRPTTDFDRVVVVRTADRGHEHPRDLASHGIHKTTILGLLNTVGTLQSFARCEAPEPSTALCAPTKRGRSSTKQKPLACSPMGGRPVRWLALDSEAKLIMSYRVGKRDHVNAFHFMDDLSRRIVKLIPGCVVTHE